ncbi:MAG TPA: hypothetical protein PLZ44_00115 [Methanothrix sp.]|nr:hypothetical protein [Methanothrix sp.]
MDFPQTEEIVEIPISELQALFEDLIQVYDTLNEVLKENGILRGRELAEMNTKASNAVKKEKSPIRRLLLLNAYIKKEIWHINNALKTRPASAPAEDGKIQQAVTKIQLRACAIVDHIRSIAQGKKMIAFNSCQARDFIAGREGKPPSRRDTIRALKRAEQICPALACSHTPNDGRQTTRLTGIAEDINESNIIKMESDRNSRQRSIMEEIRIVFFKDPIGNA